MLKTDRKTYPDGHFFWKARDYYYRRGSEHPLENAYLRYTKVGETTRSMLLSPHPQGGDLLKWPSSQVKIPKGKSVRAYGFHDDWQSVVDYEWVEQHRHSVLEELRRVNDLTRPELESLLTTLKAFQARRKST